MTLPGMDIPALKRFLCQCGIDVRGDLNVELISGGRSNLTFVACDESSRWVVRRPPLHGATPSAHDTAREFTVTNALLDSAVPVARTVAYDGDGITLGVPMSVTEFVDGVVVRHQDDWARFTDGQVSAAVGSLVQALVHLHAVDPYAVGLDAFGRPAGFLDRQVNLWSSQWRRVNTRDLPDAVSLFEALSAAVPEESAASIVHGDFRIDNVIVDPADPGQLRAVIDWELSTLGDPLSDVALMCVYRSPVFDLVLGLHAAWTSRRLPTPVELANQYATAAGRDIDNWDFYIALANFKLGVIAEGITHRALQGFRAGSASERAAEATPEFMAAGLRALKGDHS